jgi:hypothetical protein
MCHPGWASKVLVEDHERHPERLAVDAGSSREFCRI